MRNRIKHIIDFWRDTYPDYFEIGVRTLCPEERADPDKFFHRNTEDIVYAGLNVQMILSFMAHKKCKPNGKTCSHVQIRKYNDAVLWGANQAKELLPSSYYDEMKNFLDAFKKTAATAKSEGQLDEQEALVAPSDFPDFSFWTGIYCPERNSAGIPIIPVKFRFSGLFIFDRNLRSCIVSEFRPHRNSVVLLLQQFRKYRNSVLPLLQY